MPIHSAGILLFQHRPDGIRLLLVHPGGPYFARKDAGAWSIPKGLLEGDEDGLSAAKREFKEELGRDLTVDSFIPLKPVKQKGGKIVHAWAAEGDLDVAAIRSNIFRMEYPYKSGKWIDVPEVDRAEWFDVKEAFAKILPAQKPFIEELISLLTA